MKNTSIIVICDDEDENKKHVDVLDNLATEMGISTEVLLSAYQCEFDRLARQAKIRDFLYILIARKVRSDLKSTRTSV